MKEVYQFLRDSEVFYLATTDGDQPRVRPFGAVAIFEGRLYIQTGNHKKVFSQMIKNPKIEISGMRKDGSWIRIEAVAAVDDRMEARQHMINENPVLKSLYSADDGRCEVLCIKDAKAVISSFTSEPRIIEF